MQGTLLYYGIAVLALLSYAAMAILAKKAEGAIPPFTFIAGTMFVLAFLAIGSSFIFEGTSAWRNLASRDIVLMVAFGAINLIGFALFLKAITGMPIAHYQLLGILTPVVVAAIAFFIFGERVTVRFFLAVPVILFGLYLALVK